MPHESTQEWSVSVKSFVSPQQRQTCPIPHTHTKKANITTKEFRGSREVKVFGSHSANPKQRELAQLVYYAVLTDPALWTPDHSERPHCWGQQVQRAPWHINPSSPDIWCTKNTRALGNTDLWRTINKSLPPTKGKKRKRTNSSTKFHSRSYSASWWRNGACSEKLDLVRRVQSTRRGVAQRQRELTWNPEFYSGHHTQSCVRTYIHTEKKINSKFFFFF